MRVRCIRTEVPNPVKELKLSGWGVCRYLTVGAEYEVYAIKFSGIPSYLLNLDSEQKVYYFLACFFDLIDSSKPPFWIASPEYEGPVELSGPYVYEDLFDGEPEAVSALRRIRTIYEDRDLFEFINREDYNGILNNHSDDVNAVIDDSICGVSDLIEAIYHGTGNTYMEQTWDGLSEALESFAWITDRTIRIVHVGIPALEEKDLFTYFSLLRDACKEWKSPRGREQAGYLNIDVHICFLKEFRTNLEDIFYKFYV